MSDNLKEALDKAAASPDAAVRGMAIRYQEIQRESEQYAAFFSIYREGIKTSASAPLRSAPARTPVVRPAAPRADRNDTFSSSVHDILMAAGHPMQLKEVHAAYQVAHTDDMTTIETFRQRLFKRRATIVLVSKGYWWFDTPVPEEASSV